MGDCTSTLILKRFHSYTNIKIKYRNNIRDNLEDGRYNTYTEVIR